MVFCNLPKYHRKDMLPAAKPVSTMQFPPVSTMQCSIPSIFISFCLCYWTGFWSVWQVCSLCWRTFWPPWSANRSVTREKISIDEVYSQWCKPIMRISQSSSSEKILRLSYGWTLIYIHLVTAVPSDIAIVLSLLHLVIYMPYYLWWQRLLDFDRTLTLIVP